MGWVAPEAVTGGGRASKGTLSPLGERDDGPHGGRRVVPFDSPASREGFDDREPSAARVGRARLLRQRHGLAAAVSDRDFDTELADSPGDGQLPIIERVGVPHGISEEFCCDQRDFFAHRFGKHGQVVAKYGPDVLKASGRGRNAKRTHRTLLAATYTTNGFHNRGAYVPWANGAKPRTASRSLT